MTGDAARDRGPSALYPVESATIECLIALSTALDLANGLPEDKSLLTATFGAELARSLGHEDAVQASVFHAGLLRHLGCTAFAATESRMAEDDIRLRRALLLSEGDGALAALSALLDANPDWRARARGLLAALRGTDLRRDWVRQACEAARLLAADLHYGEPVLCALEEVFERWDGAGVPHQRSMEGISLAARLAQAAHTAVLLFVTTGTDAARERLTAEAGRSLEPGIAQGALAMLAVLEAPDFLVSRLERIGASAAFQVGMEVPAIAATFGDFTDLQSPFTAGHSRSVESLCRAVAAQLGMPQATQADLGLAASLHDLGQVALPSSLWLLPRAWRPAERERARSHAYHTERVLALARPLARAARIAGAHHCVNAGATAHALPHAQPPDLASRVLAAAEVACGMREARPHRPAHDAVATVSHLRALGAAGRLDRQVVEAIVASWGLRARASERAAVLTERERGVLANLALGYSNKQIARLLGISDRTVQTHTLNIYGKLGVKTRAGAVLVAARTGLVDSRDDHPPFGGFAV